MSVFEQLPVDEWHRQSLERAKIAVRERAKARFGSFVSVSSDRIELVKDDIHELVNQVAMEYSVDDLRQLYTAALSELNQKSSREHCDDDEYDELEEQKQEEQEEDKVSSVQTYSDFSLWSFLSDVETGDNYQQERVDLPTADESGLGGPSPEIDKSVSGTHEGWNLDDIDVGSKRHQQETQVMTDEPDLNNPDFDPDSPVRTRQDIEQDVEDIVGERTKTWTGTEGLADPVTN
ncbi:MAG: hypothetical protein QXU32_02385 [Nitrososphaerales archaeon]